MFRLSIAQDCHEMWSKEHKRLSRRGWTEDQIQAHFKDREIIEYQRYNQCNGSQNQFSITKGFSFAYFRYANG